jgi:L-amino acid N-acyltransferase YncA
LLQRLIEWGPALEVRALLGLIFSHNAPSLALFRQLGFHHWGLLPRVAQMEERVRDVVIVGRHLSYRGEGGKE